MGIEIHLENNYFPWEQSESSGAVCWLKGDLLYHDEPLQSPDLLSLLSPILESSIYDTRAVQDLFLDFNGSYAFVCTTPDRVLCAVDRLRSIPLFYGTTDAGLVISDDANYLRDRLSPPFDEGSGAEFLVTGYVTGSATLFEGVHQVQAGEYLDYSSVDDRLASNFYHQFLHEQDHPYSEEELLERLDLAFLRVFRRVARHLNDQGRRIVVPLSGGLDSRIIVTMLKRCGVDDVICFSYGRMGNHEARISRQVAEALGYQWLFVDYSKKNCDCPPEMLKQYSVYAGNLASSPHFQDFLAVLKLIEDGKIPENAVFVPGHSGDMLAGSHIPPIPDHPQDLSEADVIGQILRKHYRLWDWGDDAELSRLFEGKIKETIADRDVHDEGSWADAIESWDFRERQAKYIVNSVRVYEFFGRSWAMPLWDADLIDFFEGVPLRYRKNQYLYKKYAAEKLFTNTFHDLGRIECTTSLSGKGEPNGVTRDLLSLLRTKVNFVTCIFSFDIVCAVVWALFRQNPSLLKMRMAVFGFESDAYRDYPAIDKILAHGRTIRSIPSMNGLGSHAYLSSVLERNRPSHTRPGDP